MPPVHQDRAPNMRQGWRQKFDRQFSYKVTDGLNFDRSKKIASSNDIINLIKNIDNDLLDPAIMIAAEIKEILSVMMRQNGCHAAKMSGSGASCFGVFLEDKDLDAAYDNLVRVFPSYFIVKSNIYSNNI